MQFDQGQDHQGWCHDNRGRGVMTTQGVVPTEVMGISYCV